MTDLVQAARFDYPYQAELCRLYLESHGLQSVVFDAQSHGNLEGALVGVRVMILVEDLAEAEAILRTYRP